MDRRFAKFAALLVLLPLAAACTPDTPETHLSWDANDRLAPRHAPVRTADTRVYQEPDDQAMAPPVPTPRPAYRAAAVQSAPLSGYRERPAQGTPVYEYREQAAAPAPIPANAVFAWPVNGPVISSFGTTSNGERNDGINIAARRDAPIRAAASGTVSYADTLNGYGNLVLIKHDNGYVTAYAHADRLLVARGDFVAKGQVIGYAGQTGDVTSPQVHFEIRAGTKPVDPQRYLTARTGA